MTDFDAIVPAIAEALRKRGYETLTPVQQAMIDPDLQGRDALVSAQTGSGKTVAFGLAMAPTLLPEGGRFERAGAPLALAIAPTRELAMQVMRELEWLYAETGAIIGSCVGGMDIRNERRALERGAHIIVGTPGRLRDHIDMAFFGGTWNLIRGKGPRPGDWRHYSPIHPDFAQEAGVTERLIEEGFPGGFRHRPPGYREAVDIYMRRRAGTVDNIAALRALTGVDHTSPFSDRRVVDFCLCLKERSCGMAASAGWRARLSAMCSRRRFATTASRPNRMQNGFTI